MISDHGSIPFISKSQEASGFILYTADHSVLSDNAGENGTII